MKLKSIFFVLGLTLASNFLHSEETISTVRTPQFENEYVKVWRTEIAKDQPLKMHRHDCSRVLVAFNDGALTRLEENGKISVKVYEKNKAYWLTEDPGTELHACINEADEPLSVMVIEIKSTMKN